MQRLVIKSVVLGFRELVMVKMESKFVTFFLYVFVIKIIVVDSQTTVSLLCYNM